MDSEGEDRQQFAKQGGDALDLEDGEGGFQDSEDADDLEDEEEMPQKKGSGAKAPPKDVKGEKLDNQPYDLAVDVKDSEEIESDEEDDEVNMNDVGRSTQNQPTQSQNTGQSQ